MSDQPIDLTVFSAANLALAPQRGTAVRHTWDGLVRWVSHPVVTDNKVSAGGFTLARLRAGVRRKSHVEAVYALGVDHDAGTISLATAHADLVTARHLLYPTHSSTLEVPRWRAILPFDRPVTLDEYDKIWPLVHSQFADAGIPLDQSAKDACRLWYVPAIKPGATYEVLTGGGPNLDVGELLAIAKDIELEREAVRRKRPAPPPPADLGRHDRYVRGAIEKAAASIAAGSPGQRHYLVSKEAYSLARFGLTESEIRGALLPAALRAMGEARRPEIERTIRDAYRARCAS